MNRAADVKFWMVWSPTGSTPPRVRHANYAEAVRAAEDMARSHPNQEFYVMQAVSRSAYVTVQTVQLVDDESQIPF